jgi:hypothetical protein
MDRFSQLNISPSKHTEHSKKSPSKPQNQLLPNQSPNKKSSLSPLSPPKITSLSPKTSTAPLSPASPANRNSTENKKPTREELLQQRKQGQGGGNVRRENGIKNIGDNLSASVDKDLTTGEVLDMDDVDDDSIDGGTQKELGGIYLYA